jgi:predicted DNA-binding transcriptional regulator AlpA
MVLKIHRIKEVCDRTGLKESSVYKQIRLKLFPPGIKLTARSRGWTSESIDDWLQQRINGGNK